MPKDPMTATDRLLEKYFSQLKDPLCWETDTEYTCWLRLRFGKPSIRIREAAPPARRRRARIDSEFVLFFEMGEWEYVENGKRRYRSGTSRLIFRRLAERLHSQYLTRVELLARPGESMFVFDTANYLHVWPAGDAEPDDSLWYLSGSGGILTMKASGALSDNATGRKFGRKIQSEPAVFQL